MSTPPITATPADQGRTRSSKRWVRGPGSPRTATAGTQNPSSTPAMVACTPEACMNAQATTATGSSSHHAVRRRRTRTPYSTTAASAPASIGAEMCSV